MHSSRRPATIIKYALSSLLLIGPSCAMCAGAHHHISSGHYSGPGSDETILIEDATRSEVRYSDILKQVSAHFFGFDVDALLSSPQANRDPVVRRFSDYAERIDYKVDLDQNEVTFKMKVAF